MRSMITQVNCFYSGYNPIFHESVTEIKIDDEAGGPYITMKQTRDDNESVLKFDIDELEYVFAEAKKLFDQANKIYEEENLYDKTHS